MRLLPILVIITGLIAACARIATEDDDAAEEGEELAGGTVTIFDADKTAFSHPLPAIDRDRERDFFKGRALFRDAWVIAPASTTSRDGLGPIFNARSCEECHRLDGRGRPPEAATDPMLTMLVRLSSPEVALNGGSTGEPTYGGQIQPFAIPGVVAEGSATVAYEAVSGTYQDGEPFELQRPIYDFTGLKRGPLQTGTLFSPRVAPVMIGLGLLEAVPETTILALADENDADGDGISGRPNLVWNELLGDTTLGRFGWKANQPTLRQQVAGAFLGDIGITSELAIGPECTSAETDCAALAGSVPPELESVILDTVTLYSSTLAVPARRDVASPAVLWGKRLFTDLRCASCHTPKLLTGSNEHVPQLSGQIIRPFTDLLLHDMGEDLSDGRPDFLATGTEWRTPPLWGIGLLETVNGHLRLMHDGRARGYAEAILWHGGEAQASRDGFVELTKDEREALLLFLASL